MSSDFRPKFPLDPFAPIKPSPGGHRHPWVMKADSVFQHSRDVMLVLGAPNAKELEPLFCSRQLSASLLLIVTHRPPEIPAGTLPTVRVLRLNEPLAIENAGSVRLVNVLEWAERVARVWRKRGGEGIVEISEDDNGSESTYLAPPNKRASVLLSRSMPGSPGSSYSDLPTQSRSLTSSPTLRHRVLSSNRLTESRSSLPAIDSTQRPFDALINFLPSKLPEKALLKQLILVTTISRPFLTAAVPVSQARSLKSKRRSVLVRSPSSRPTSPLPSPESNSLDSLVGYTPSTITELAIASTSPAHLVHLLTQDRHVSSRTKLVQSMEAFLLSFCYPTPTTQIQAQMEYNQSVRPYLLQSSVFADSLRLSPFGGSECEADVAGWGVTIADAIVSGGLDLEADASPRAWISSPTDIVSSASTHLTPAPRRPLSTVRSSPDIIVTTAPPHITTFSRTGSDASSSACESSPPSTPPPTLPLTASLLNANANSKFGTVNGYLAAPSQAAGENVNMNVDGGKKVQAAAGNKLRRRSSVMPGSTRSVVDREVQQKKKGWLFWRRSHVDWAH